MSKKGLTKEYMKHLKHVSLKRKNSEDNHHCSDSILKFLEAVHVKEELFLFFHRATLTNPRKFGTGAEKIAMFVKCNQLQQTFCTLKKSYVRLILAQSGLGIFLSFIISNSCLFRRLVRCSTLCAMRAGYAQDRREGPSTASARTPDELLDASSRPARAVRHRRR